MLVACDCAVENAVLAVRAGAIDAVVAVMRAQVANAGVLEQACLALGNICEDIGTLSGWAGYQRVVCDLQNSTWC